MRLLVDTDIFCKLAVGGLLEDAVGVLGSTMAECERLAALPHQLRKGRVRKQIGDAHADALMPVAASVAVMTQTASAQWLDPLVGIPNLDPGETQMFAVAAEHGLVMMTGDKRALKALVGVPQLHEALSGRIVTLEAILIRLCDVQGVEAIRGRIGPARDVDKMVKACFPAWKSDTIGGLESYYNGLVAEVAPLKLWDPRL